MIRWRQSFPSVEKSPRQLHQAPDSTHNPRDGAFARRFSLEMASNLRAMVSNLLAMASIPQGCFMTKGGLLWEHVGNPPMLPHRASNPHWQVAKGRRITQLTPYSRNMRKMQTCQIFPMGLPGIHLCQKHDCSGFLEIWMLPDITPRLC